MNIVRKVWGQEDLLVNGPLYAAKYLWVKKGGNSSIHRHTLKDETFICLEGAVLIRFWVGLRMDGETLLEPGDRPVHVEPGRHHSFSGVSDLSQILEVSTHDDPEDCVRLTASSYQP